MFRPRPIPPKITNGYQPNTPEIQGSEGLKPPPAPRIPPVARSVSLRRELILALSPDLAASGVAYKERLNIPVIAEQVAREQPENLRTYFMERLRHYRQLSLQLPKGNDPAYQKTE